MARSSFQKLKILYVMDYLLKSTDEEHPVSVAQLIAQLESHGISAEALYYVAAQLVEKAARGTFVEHLLIPALYYRRTLEFFRDRRGAVYGADTLAFTAPYAQLRFYPRV